MRQITTAPSITNIYSRSLKDYLHDISRYKLLTKDEERYIGQLSKRGNMKARRKLINSNLRFAVTVAKHYQGRGLPLEDLIAEANAGICRAAERWNVDLGYRFITYALWWMRQCITKALTNKSRTIRIAQGPVEIQYRINKYRQEYIQKYGEAPTDEELAKLCRCTLPQLENALNSDINYTSLDTSTSSDSDAPLIIEAIPNNNVDSTDTSAEHKNKREVILNILNSKYFTKIERDIVLDYYGFSDPNNESKYLKNLCEKYHKSTECIRQTKLRAIIKLKKYFRKTLKELL